MAERCVPKLTVRETRAAAQRLERLMTQFSPFSEVMAEERRFRVAARHRVLTGADPAWVGGRAPSRYAMWEARARIFFSPKRVILSRLDREYAAMEAFSRLEWPARPRPRMARPPIEWQLAGQAGDTCATSDAQLRLLRLQLALHSHHLRTGNYPADLRELSGLPDRTVRLDPFTGQPFCYTRIGTGYRLYSLGRDARDDGGDPQRDVVAGELRSLL